MKMLRIVYDDIELFAGTVDELTWTDSAGQVSVSGKIRGAKNGGGVADLLGALAGKKPSVEERRAAYEVEKAQ